MKVINKTTLAEVELPDDMLWKDEFDWSPVSLTKGYGVTGALLLDFGVKQGGRPISLAPPDPSMAWVLRSVVDQLKVWAQTPELEMTLVFEYETDVRTFNVIFDSADGGAMKAEPVLGHPGHSPGDWFRVEIKFLEVEV